MVVQSPADGIAGGADRYARAYRYVDVDPGDQHAAADEYGDSGTQRYGLRQPDAHPDGWDNAVRR